MTGRTRQALAVTPRLVRENFTTGRQAEFTSIKELTATTGHPSDQRPLVALNELAGIDAAEMSGVSPDINITMTDDGPNVGADTVAYISDFSVRASSAEAHSRSWGGARGH